MPDKVTTVTMITVIISVMAGADTWAVVKVTIVENLILKLMHHRSIQFFKEEKLEILVGIRQYA